MSHTTYLFYDVMKYPIPFQKEFFAYEEIVSTMKAPEPVAFSRAKPCEHMEEYIALVDKLGRLRRSLPFVEALYLANSITFNALHDDSDIDLFFVVSPGRIRLAQFCSNLMLLVLGLRRWKGYKRKKFSLSFYIHRDHINMQSIKMDRSDPYLLYRLAHLVPVYMRQKEYPLDIYQENYWLRDYFPTFPMEHVIQLGNTLFSGGSRVKGFFERMLGGWFGSIIEYIIKIFSVPVLLRKKKRLGPLGEHIIISDIIMKLHADKRQEYAMKWKIAKKSAKG